MYYTEVLIPEWIRKSDHATKDPEKADLFMIPHKSTCFYHHCVFNQKNTTTDQCKHNVALYMEGILDHIAQEYQFFNRSQGTDHLMVLSWDQASEVFGYFNRTQEHWVTSIRGRLQGMVHLTSTGYVGYRENFDPHKDIVIPPFVSFEPAKEWLRENSDSLHVPVNPNSTQEVQDILKHYNNKTIFGFFRGAILDDRRYSFGIRQFLQVHYGNMPDYLIINDHAPKDVYYSELYRSLFCLAPAGWSPWSPRIFECLLFNSIPVILSDGVRLPFENILDYKLFSVKLLRTNLKDMHKFLLKVARKVEFTKKMFEQIENAKQAFIWDDSQHVNAFKMLMQELQLKKSLYKPLGNTQYP
jgi:hypothetical protein